MIVQVLEARKPDKELQMYQSSLNVSLYQARHGWHPNQPPWH
jgi:hypothetical protein